jgi:tRNA U34 5-methylaminomethyl-2-thiouridine-forming methyltransferase MnmC
MKFTIAGKEYDLKFGLKFIRELDKIYTVNYEGLEFGMGVNMAYMNLQQFNPTALAEVIKAAVSHESSPPKMKQIEEAVEEYAEENDGLEQLFEDVLEELGKSKVTKATIERFKKLGAANG